MTPPPSPPALPPAVRQRLLVAEDVADTRDTLQELLQLTLGVEVDVALVGLKTSFPYSVLDRTAAKAKIDHAMSVKKREAGAAKTAAQSNKKQKTLHLS